MCHLKGLKGLEEKGAIILAGLLANLERAIKKDTNDIVRSIIS